MFVYEGCPLLAELINVCMSGVPPIGRVNKCLYVWGAPLLAELINCCMPGVPQIGRVNKCLYVRGASHWQS